MPTSIIGPVLGGVLGLIGSNNANKSTQAAADNANTAARAQLNQAYQTAYGNEQQAVNSAQAALAKWFQGNPGPAAGWGNAQMPDASAAPSMLGGANMMPPNASLQYALSPSAGAGFGGGARLGLQPPTFTRPPQAPPSPQGNQPPAPQGGQSMMNPTMLQSILSRISMRGLPQTQPSPGGGFA